MKVSEPATARDWLAWWQHQYDAERDQANRYGVRPPGDDRWHGQAARYARASHREAQPDAVLRWLLPQLKPGDTLLDIGAGVGRHSLYLANVVAEVIAIEPSAAMRMQLEERVVAQAPRPRVQIYPAAWPAAAHEELQGDVALASHVIYGVREIGPFLLGMQQHVRRLCVIVAGFRQPAAFIAPFWEQHYGVAKIPLPGALECLHVLAQLGIAAQLTLIPCTPFTFADLDEARADIRWRLRLSEETGDNRTLDDMLATHLEPLPDGRLAPQQQPSHHAVIWWSPTPCGDGIDD